MATLEERVEKLEGFMGNIDKIKSVYANSIEEICNRWLNILYIEYTDSDDHIVTEENTLYVNGFLTDLTGDVPIPYNSIFFIKPKHTFAYSGGTNKSYIEFERDGERVPLNLKKVNPENPGHTTYLTPGDYIAGNIYMVYVDSQGECLISASDLGAAALQIVQAMQSTVETLDSTVSDINYTLEHTINPNIVDTKELRVSELVSLNECPAFQLPSGCTITGTPADGNHIVNKSYVDSKIWSEIMRYHSTYHLFDSIPPQDKLSPTSVPEGALYYKYPN